MINLFLFEHVHDFTLLGQSMGPMIYFTAEVLPYLLGGFAILYLLTGKNKKAALRIGIEVFAVAAFASLVSYGIKKLIGEPRPFMAIPELIPLFRYGGFDGFPSGHTAFFTALGGALSLRSPHLGSIYVFLALLIGLARVAAGVHWPLDILGGFVLGLIISSLYVRFKVGRHQDAVHKAMVSVRKELK